MKAFNPIYNKAGNETHKLSLTLSLAITPKNISNARPPEEISKIAWTMNPASNPSAPLISKTAVSSPNFSSPNRLNSLFICGDVNQLIPYIKKDKLEIRISITVKRVKKLNLEKLRQ